MHQRSSNAEMIRQRRGPAPTGEVLDRGGAFAVCLGRSFTVGIDVVWAWLTEPDKLRIWLGESDGAHLFRLAGATVATPPLTFDVEEVDPPHRVALGLRNEEGAEGDATAWRVDLSLTPLSTGCHLLLEQTIVDRVPAPSVAAGCEFYLDRLVRVCHGQPFTDLDPDDYFLSQGESYRRMFPLPRAGGSRPERD